MFTFRSMLCKAHYEQAWYRGEHNIHTDGPPTATRACGSCGVVKPVTAFAKDSDECKRCYRIAYATSNSKQRLYGISQEEYTQKVEQQDGVCAICGGVNANGYALSIDHDHETGEVRELLCTPCNTLLGVAYDKPEILLKAVEYLSRHRMVEAQ